MHSESVFLNKSLRSLVPNNPTSDCGKDHTESMLIKIKLQATKFDVYPKLIVTKICSVLCRILEIKQKRQTEEINVANACFYFKLLV